MFPFFTSNFHLTLPTVFIHQMLNVEALLWTKMLWQKCSFIYIMFVTHIQTLLHTYTLTNTCNLYIYKFMHVLTLVIVLQQQQ